MSGQGRARTEFRSRLWLKLGTLLAVAISITLLAFSIRARGVSLQTWVLGAISALAVAGLVEALVARVSLEERGVRVFSVRRRYFVPRAEIESVTWESGSPVALRLTSGAWIELPDLGHNTQGVANSIRAWLQRPQTAGVKDNRGI